MENCPKCNRPLHKLHDCLLNPVAVPALAEILSLAEDVRHEVDIDGDQVWMLDQLDKIISLCRTAQTDQA